MAITITRTPWIDDDGTGTSGTVLNNAEKTAIYNQIDEALAKAAQLNGGNAFSGNQTLVGLLTVNALGGHTIQAGGSGQQSLLIQNTAAGTNNSGALLLGNDASGSLTTLASLSSTFTPSGAYQANGSIVIGAGAGGLSVAASHAAGALRLYAGGPERVRVAPTGEVWINATANIGGGGGRFGVAADASLHNGITIQNTNASINSIYFMLFYNGASAIAGNIQQTGVNTVAFGTSSDARLKDDAGRAQDVSALRAVVVHDFTWKADGIRDRGVFAQEAHALYPRAVSRGTDDRTERGDLTHPWMTDYSKFVPDLIVGWQQHDAALAELRAALAAVKGSPDAQ